MARPDKVAVVEEVRRELADSSATLLAHYHGLSVTEMAQLRRRLRDADARLRIVKNTLSRRAADAAGIEGLDDLLVGPTGLIFCREDPVGPAKAVKEFQREHPGLELRGGYLDGELLDDRAAMQLAELESREELLARLAGLMQGALSGTARLLQAATEKQARLLAALLDAGGPEARGFGPGDGAGTDSSGPAGTAAQQEEPAATEAAPADADQPADESAADPAPDET